MRALEALADAALTVTAALAVLFLLAPPIAVVVWLVGRVS